MNEPIEQKELTPEELEALDNNAGVVAEETTEPETEVKKEESEDESDGIQSE